MRIPTIRNCCNASLNAPQYWPSLFEVLNNKRQSIHAIEDVQNDHVSKTDMFFLEFSQEFCFRREVSSDFSRILLGVFDQKHDTELDFTSEVFMK